MVGHGGVPAEASSVVVNVTVAEPSATGYFTVWPSGEARSETSVLNFAPGQVAANMAILKVGAGGQLSLYNYGGAAHAIIDVMGYFSPASGATYTPVPSRTLLDTRQVDAMSAGQVVTLYPLGQGYVPGSGVSAIALNLTGDQSSQQTYLTAYPSGAGMPPTSNLNLQAGGTRANLAIVEVGTGGGVDVFNEAGTVHLIADVVGYFTQP